ncbi:glycosyl hydrolase family 31 protein [Aphelenchoides avenae]|nr:glycosyl hydrolase family 31 protein [Aphelenchus avenae]
MILQTAIFLLVIPLAAAVDRGNFKTCEQATFCTRHRKQTEKANYEVDPATVRANETAVEAELVSAVNRLKLAVVLLEDSSLRIQINEAGTPLRPRFQPLLALNGEPKQKKLPAADTGKESTSFVTPEGHKIVVAHKPFRIDVFHGKELLFSVNSKQLLKFEHFREKKEGETAEEEGFWEETFKSHRDSKPYGSSSVGLDVSFVGFKFLFGLPEHADSFALRTTTNGDPYRMYNLDVFEYELNNPMALYGSVPYVVAHNKEHSLGALWLNAAETWVDIASSTADKGVLASLVDQFRSSKDVPEMSAHFISESGVIDLFLLLGPKPNDLFRQYSALTGVYPLPPIFSVGYHQCRWNYNDEADVAAVHAGFDEHDIPMDAIWLDIEHTDGKRYFTWDPVKFANSKKMIEDVEAKVRKK